MKYEETEQALERVGITKKTTCGIAVNAKTFQMLARQYSNPIKAIIQELSSNAYDSQVRAGKKDVPFKIKLPNKLDPSFKVRDYGVSMSPEVIYNVYANYMASDKTNSNDEIGYFGLGSKTPFSYTDSFNITTYLDGVKRLYVLSYNEQKVPELNEFPESTTDEENGVEISFSVKREDHGAFENEAARVFSFFEVKPEVTGSASYKEEAYSRILEGSNWYLTNDPRVGSSFAIMGNVAYAISYSESPNPDNIDHKKLVVTFNIGDLNVTPSREALEYTPLTRSNLNAAYKKVYSEIKDLIIDNINSYDNYYEACMYANKISNDFRIVKLNDISWKGKEFTAAKYLHVSNEVSKRNSYVSPVSKAIKDVIAVPFDKKTRIVIRDEDKRNIARSRYFCGNMYSIGTPVEIYYIDPYSILKKEEVEDLDINPNNILKDIRHFFGLKEDSNVAIMSSTLPDPPIVVSTVKKKTIKKNHVKMMKFKKSSQNAPLYTNWEEYKEVDLNDASEQKIYIETTNFSIGYDTDDAEYLSFRGFVGKSPDGLRRLLETIQKVCNVPTPVMYGVGSKQVIERVKKYPHFISVKDWVKSILTSKHTKDIMTKWYEFTEIRDIPALKILKTLSKHPMVFVDDKSLFRDVYDTIKSAPTFYDVPVSSQFLSLYELFTGHKRTTNGNLKKKIHNLYEEYHIVMCYLDRYSSNTLADITIAKRINESVNAIDMWKRETMKQKEEDAA